MKHLLTAIFSLAICVSVFAQSPSMFNYQAVARSMNGNVIENQAIGLKISLISDSPLGSTVYSETHSATTNEFGLFNVIIGSGTVVSGTFTSIDWGSNSYYVKVGLDVAGGTSYVEMGTSQLLSVPYALYAENSGTAATPASIYFQSSSLNSNPLNATTTYQPVGPTFVITKTHAASKIEVTCNTTVGSGTFAGGATGVRFEIRIDGNTADYDNEAVIKGTNTSDFVSMFAVFEGLAVGSHTIQIYANTNTGTSSTVYIDPGGWGARMIAKETF